MALASSLQQVVGALIFGSERPLSIEEIRACLQEVGALDEQTRVFADAAPRVVLTSPALAATLGDPVPLLPSAFMLMISAPMPPFLKPVVGAAGRPLSFKQYGNGTVLIGGGYQGRLDRDRDMTELDFAGLGASARTGRGADGFCSSRQRPPLQQLHL
jgi:hypothetical protein